jgi:hypothetical protein
MTIDKNFNSQKSSGKPIDAGAPSAEDKRLETPTIKGSGLDETKPTPGNEAPGQVAKM